MGHAKYVKLAQGDKAHKLKLEKMIWKIKWVENYEDEYVNMYKNL